MTPYANNIYVNEDLIANLKTKNINLLKKLERFVNRLREYPYEEALSQWERREGILYKRIDPYRVVGLEKTIDNKKVIIILDILKKETSEYNNFISEPHLYLKKLKIFELLFNIKEAINKEKKVKEEKEIKQNLPEEYYLWFEPFLEGGERWWKEFFICESMSWSETFKKTHYQDYWQSYYELLNEIINATESGRQIGKLYNSFYNIYWVYDKNKRHKIFFSIKDIYFDDPKFFKNKTIFLIDALDSEKEKENFKDLEKYENLLKEDLIKWDNLAKHSARAYPAYVLADEDLWKGIQKEEENNLALSIEEIRILENILYKEGQDKEVLPVFINGRAGSGKSTLLYYTFAHYIYRKYKKNLNGKILFLTYSDSLLEIAKKNCQKILEKSLLEIDIDKQINFDEIFKSFKNFLLSLCKNEEPQKFSEENYISFAKFRRIYLNKGLNHEENQISFRSKGRVSPDLAWHIIRTYIKGYNPNNYLTPEEYEYLVDDDKSVSMEDFIYVYKNVWEAWYKKLTVEKEYWDILDLTRYILNNNLIKNEYTVIFCDESQDFTRIELNLILKLLIYYSYSLKGRNLRIPFVLAGDPFQTLNPTGFRWESIKSSFYHTVSNSFKGDTIKLAFEELSYNYRSNESIVRLSNLIQLIRKSLFNIFVTPQYLWKEEHSHILTYLYILDDKKLKYSETVKIIKEKHPVIIIPTEENEEIDFAQKDEILSKLTKNISSFISPITAKGMEFDQVILFKFGDNWLEDYFGNDFLISNDLIIRKEYLLNKLYVAITRAKSKLVIIDTLDGYNKLWKYLENENTLKEAINIEDDVLKEWKDNIGYIVKVENLENLLEQQSYLEIAEQYKDKGFNIESPELFKIAAKYYRLEGPNYEKMAIWCEGKAFFLKQKYLEAAELFEKIKEYKEAEKCLWQGKYWKELLKLYQNNSFDYNKFYYTIVEFYNNSNYSTALTMFEKLLRLTINWNELKDALLIAFDEILKNFQNLDNEDKIKLYDFLTRLPSPIKQDKKLGEQLGKLFYKLDELKFAINIWEKIRKTSHQDYYLAKASISTELEEKIYWLRQAGKWDVILNIYKSNKIDNFNKIETLEYIKWAIEQGIREKNAIFKDYLTLWEILWLQNDIRKAINFLDEFIKFADENNQTKNLIKNLYNQYSWCLDAENFYSNYAMRIFDKIENFLTLNEKWEWVKKYLVALTKRDYWDTFIEIITDDNAKAYLEEKIKKLSADFNSKEKREIVPSLQRTFYIPPIFMEIVKSKFYEVMEVLFHCIKNEEISLKNKNLLTFYLEYLFWRTNIYKKEENDFRKIGEAYEIVARDIDSIRLYKKIMEMEEFPNNIRNYAKERWKSLKEKRINFLKGKLEILEKYIQYEKKLEKMSESEKKELIKIFPKIGQKIPEEGELEKKREEIKLNLEREKKELKNIELDNSIKLIIQRLRTKDKFDEEDKKHLKQIIDLLIYNPDKFDEEDKKLLKQLIDKNL